MAKKRSARRKIPLHGDASWFTEARFGLFIHWGLYSLAARHEWIRNRELISNADYQKYFEHFDPDLYDPTAWAALAADAGMKYFVVTTKHHEGFCMWDSKHTDYKATNTPARRDLIAPMVEAFRARNFRVGFYHSLIDWHHPHYTVDRLHPMRNDAAFCEASKKRDMGIYRKYLHAQVRELLTKFAPVDYLWADFSFDQKGRKAWASEKLMKMIRTLAPKILIDDRLDLLDVPGGWDVRTPEQFMLRKPYEMDGRPVLWETCQTFSGSWGYHRDEATWKSVRQLLTLLIDTVGKNGNLLLNVGATARGAWDDRAKVRLAGIGAWMKLHGRSIYGCGAAPAGIECPPDCRLTYHAKSNRLYVHVLNWPLGQLHVDGLAGKIAYAQLLNDASEVRFTEGGSPSEAKHAQGVGADTLTLQLPTIQPRVEVPVVELMMK